MTMARLSLGTFLAAVGIVAFVLVLRRASGALVSPLGFLPALGIGLLLSAGTWMLRRLVLALAPDRPRLLVGITAITWMLVVAITISHTSPLAIVALWLPLVATEAYWRVVPYQGSTPSARPVSPPLPGSPAPPPESLIQQLTRLRENGRERVNGKARIDFAAGEQTTALHVVFSPPLAKDPSVAAEAPDAEGITIRATECRTYGLRLEARRGRDSAAALTVLVQFEASCAWE
jgi:hypothetical protein